MKKQAIVVGSRVRVIGKEKTARACGWVGRMDVTLNALGDVVNLFSGDRASVRIDGVTWSYAVEDLQAVAPKFSIKDRVALNQPYGQHAAGTIGTVIGSEPNACHNECEGDLVHVRTDTGDEFEAFAYRFDHASAKPEAVPERRKLKTGDVVIATRATTDITEGKEYVATSNEDDYGFVFVRDDVGDHNGLLKGHEFTFVRTGETSEVSASAATGVRDFRIRKHGARGEIRGTSYATLADAESAIGRYMPGNVYEIVEVQVVRTVKVEQEVRVVDYKEAA